MTACSLPEKEIARWKNHKRAFNGPVRSLMVAALVAVTTQGCGAADVDRSTADVAAEDSTAKSADALHAFPGIALLSWRGAPPQPSQLTSNRPGLHVVY